MRFPLLASMLVSLLLCGCEPPTAGPGLPGDGTGLPGDGTGLPGGGTGLPGDGAGLPGDGAGLPGGGTGLPGDGAGLPGDGASLPGGGSGAGMVQVVNGGCEANDPPDGPIAVAVVPGSEQPKSIDAYTILALGESASFPVSGDTFTIFVCDPADPVNKVYEQETVNVGDLGGCPVGVSSSQDLGGTTQISVP